MKASRGDTSKKENNKYFHSDWVVLSKKKKKASFWWQKNSLHFSRHGQNPFLILGSLKGKEFAPNEEVNSIPLRVLHIRKGKKLLSIRDPLDKIIHSLCTMVNGLFVIIHSLCTMVNGLFVKRISCIKLAYML